MALNSRQICKIIKSDSTSRKIVVEVDGKVITTEKVIGLDFRPGDYACFQLFAGSGKSLVVALGPEEIKKIKGLKVEEHGLDKRALDEEKGLSFPEPDTGFVPLDEEIFNQELADERKRSFLDPDLITSPKVINRLRVLFEDYVEENEEEDCLKDIFPVVAVQNDPQYKPLQDSLFEKADQIILRKLVKEQSNRDVLHYFDDLVRNISSEEDHKKFFDSLGFYLNRLRKIQQQKRWSSEKMGVIFHPIYLSYIKKFKRDRMEEWIKTKSVN